MRFSEKMEVIRSLLSENHSLAEQRIRDLLEERVLPYNVVRFCNEALRVIGPCSTGVPFLTVLTLSHNNLKGLKRTIESVSSQTLASETEHIIIDLGSMDGSIDYIKNDAQADVQLITLESMGDQYSYMGRSIELSRSQYTLFLNAGDFLFSERVVEDFAGCAKRNNYPKVILGGFIDGSGLIRNPLPPDELWKSSPDTVGTGLFNTETLRETNFHKLDASIGGYELLCDLLGRRVSFFCSNSLLYVTTMLGARDYSPPKIRNQWTVANRELSNVVKSVDINEYFEGLLAYSESSFIENGSPKYSVKRSFEEVEKNLVFLISMPRSGSTLLQKVMSGIKEVGTLGEPWTMLPLLSMYNLNNIDAIYGQQYNIKAKDALLSSLHTDVIGTAQKAYVVELYSAIIQHLDCKMFLDKTPRYIYIIEELTKLLPNARFIVLLRDPAAIITSYAETWRNGDFQRVYEDRYYRKDFSEGFNNLARFVDGDFDNKLIVRYEDLASNPNDQLRRICSYLGVSFDKEILTYGAKSQPKFTFGDPENVYQNSSVHAKSVDAWVMKIASPKRKEGFFKCSSLVEDPIYEKIGYKKLTPKDLDLLIESKHAESVSGLRQICIVTPSFNAAETIERTIRSVLYQEVPEGYLVRYHVQDGGSTDATNSIVAKYVSEVISNRRKFGRVVMTHSSEKDFGMYDAIAKGFEGLNIVDALSWMTWINSDDFLSKNAFRVLGDIDVCDEPVRWVTGAIGNFSTDFSYTEGVRLHCSKAIRGGLAEGLHMCFIQQEGTFWRNNLWEEHKMSTRIRKFLLAGDWFLWKTFASTESIYVFEKPLGYFCKREGQLSQSNVEEYYSEIDSVVSSEARSKSLQYELEPSDVSNILRYENHRIVLEQVSIERELNIWKKKRGML